MIISSRNTVGARTATPVRRHLVAIVTAMAALCCLPVAAEAQDWPRRPVRIVSPFAAGGSSDTMGRIVAENLSQRLHQQFDKQLYKPEKRRI
jgi:tripartite-type tricarboxylate transporter receptor subunit TctC